MRDTTRTKKEGWCNMEKRMAKVILYNNKFKPRPIPFGVGDKEETYYWEMNDHGFYILECPKGCARLIIGAHPDRFRLFESKCLDTQVTDGNGRTTWVVLNPWVYDIVTVADGVDEKTGEKKTKRIAKWSEDVGAVLFTGKKPLDTLDELKPPPPPPEPDAPPPEKTYLELEDDLKALKEKTTNEIGANISVGIERNFRKIKGKPGAAKFKKEHLLELIGHFKKALATNNK